VSPEPNPADSGAVLRVVNPDATAEEIAALVAVLSALGSAAPAPRKPVAAWAANARKMRVSHPHGRAGWRASGLPG
jgi:Ser/Thr protein kinase RdoA (MazF antagonist)